MKKGPLKNPKDIVTLPTWYRDILEVIAIGALRYKGKRNTPENIEKEIILMSQESFDEALTPGGEHGHNPTPRVATKDFEIAAKDFLGPSGFFKKYSSSTVEYNTNVKKFKTAVSYMSTIYLDVILKLHPKQKGKDLTNISDLSPYQYAKKSGDKATQEELEQMRTADIHRYYRLFVETVVISSLTPLFEMDAKEFISLMSDIGLNEANRKALKAKGQRETFVRVIGNGLKDAFSKIDIIRSSKNAIRNYMSRKKIA